MDICFAIYAPSIGPDIFLIKSDLSYQPSSAGLEAWRRNTAGPINETLFGDVPISGLPPGIYSLYLAVTPAGSLESYYLWETNFSIIR